MRAGKPVLDLEFDGVYSAALRTVSSQFWTPVAVARRAAELLVGSQSTRVLDVGSGIGKFCIVGAAATGASFIGLEHREHFVAVSKLAASRYGTPSAHFVHGAFHEVEIEAFDAVYFFNPFEENLWEGDGQLDQTVELGPHRFSEDVDRARSMLARARVGTRVVTYHGLGADLPSSFRLQLRERQRSGFLDLWIQSREGRAAG